MKFKEYFDKKKNLKLSAGDRLQIYQNFISKRSSKSFYLKRQIFVVKSFGYSFIVFFLLAGLYGTYIFQGNIIINKDGFLIQRPNLIKSVQADYIAKIIEFNGNFHILHNGKHYQGSYISNGDLVTLQDGSELVFHIDEATEAKIKGPAKFSITKSLDQYKLSLIQGDFIKVKSLQTQTPQDLEILTKNISIKKSDQTNSIDFEMSKQGEERLLKNNGPQLIITKNTLDKQTIQKELDSSRILSIQENDISIINDEKLTQAIIQKNITQTLGFSEIQTDLDEIDLDKILSQEYSQQTDPQKISENIGLPNDKLIPTEYQISKLSSILSKDSFSKDIKNINENYIQGEDKINGNITNIQNNIRQIFNSFEINYTTISGDNDTKNLSELTDNINKLISILQEKYHIPPTYIDNLKQLVLNLSNIVN